MTDQEIPTVADDRGASRFVAVVDGVEAQLVYERAGDRLVLVHTEVPESLGGRGLGGRLVRHALDIAHDEGLRVEARCPFARRWIDQHRGEVRATLV